jgi:hypothetical protein
MRITLLWQFTLLIGLTGAAGVVAGQKPEKCRVQNNNNHMAEYRMGRVERTKGSAPTALIQISVPPQHINRNDLVALGTQLKKVFCEEQRLDIVIFDSYLYAQNFSPVEENPYYRQGLESMRGLYYLDRTTGEEFVEFSTVPNYFRSKQARVKITICQNSPC